MTSELIKKIKECYNKDKEPIKCSIFTLANFIEKNGEAIIRNTDILTSHSKEIISIKELVNINSQKLDSVLNNTIDIINVIKEVTKQSTINNREIKNMQNILEKIERRYKNE